MGLEDTLLNGTAYNAPLALALVYAFNRIENKLDKIVMAVQVWGGKKPPLVST